MPGRSMTTQANLPNKFTGKEWDDDFGLNWHHFDWRPYDGEIGRWLGVDPLLEKYPGVSPYNYTLNNPIKLVDPDGKAPGIRTGYVGVAFNKYLGVRNRFITSLNQRAVAGGVAGFAAGALSTAIEFLTPSSLAEQWSGSALGLLGTISGIGASSKLLKLGDSSADLGVGVVRHFTDDAGKAAISKAGFLKKNAFVTRPGDVPKGATPKDVEKFLEVKPGRGQNFIDVEVKPSDLKIPDNGIATSGGGVQRQTTRKIPIKPEDFKRTEK